ncbi:eukaryotic translation initiation factor 3 subunit L-like [Pyrus ussuriensis x Pyrus communis]|uniref:Eukaryotic translation initiation factor 3 subunit L n=1 Tax=Pyrus ussuriensis x Pyrus communis TaxID=2448454 RepID=A0A5N5HTX5_9ROSA|nr:eukaryotic translation initiation factor 3 subunit L-like [Pyrus ussuriensis x Pyrus communis]
MAAYDYDDAGTYDETSATQRQPSSGAPPSSDLGYDPNFVPDSVKSFVVHLYRYIREKNVYEIHQMYETSFQTLSDRLFKDTPWPSVDAVADYVDNDHVFCLLYREMWFRHLYARLSPTLKQRIDSWDNYCSLFQVVLHGVVNMQLPNQWLWDMVDEFVYQFQSFCQYRAKMKNKNEQEIALLRQFDQAWNVYGVLNFLQALVEKSMIIQILEQEKEGLEQFTANDGYDYNGGSNVLKVLGYFSMVGLLRVHCLLGDYHTGLKCLQPIDITQQGVFTTVIGSHITTIYHYGFANLMLRRYVEAIREFNKILLYIYKTKQFHQKSPQYEQILKKNEQMYALLAIALSLCPQVKLVEETVNSQLREKYGEKMNRMQRYDDEAFAIYDELFSYACPKFITPSPPSFEEPLVNYNQDAYRLQLKLFLYEVKQQQLLSGVRTFLKVYSSISVGKLASYMEVDEAKLRTILLTYKHKTHSVDTEGKVISNADVDFYIDDDLISVVESKPVKRYGDYFLRQIVKLEGVINDMDRVKKMVGSARLCLHNSMRALNLFVNVCGVGVIIYSLWLIKKWQVGVSELPPVSHVPKPWFIYTCLGMGIAVCLSTLCGHMVANSISSFTLFIVSFLVITTFLLIFGLKSLL